MEDYYIMTRITAAGVMSNIIMSAFVFSSDAALKKVTFLLFLIPHRTVDHGMHFKFGQPLATPDLQRLLQHSIVCSCQGGRRIMAKFYLLLSHPWLVSGIIIRCGGAPPSSTHRLFKSKLILQLNTVITWPEIRVYTMLSANLHLASKQTLHLGMN